MEVCTYVERIRGIDFSSNFIHVKFAGNIFVRGNDESACKGGSLISCLVLLFISSTSILRFFTWLDLKANFLPVSAFEVPD